MLTSSISKEGGCPGSPWLLFSQKKRRSALLPRSPKAAVPETLPSGTRSLPGSCQGGGPLSGTFYLPRPRGLYQLRDSQNLQMVSTSPPSRRNRLEGGNSLPGPRSINQDLECRFLLSWSGFLTRHHLISRPTPATATHLPISEMYFPK